MRPPREIREITVAANNGEIGGGEVMLLNLADALTTLGHAVTVVGPSSPGDLLDAARAGGHPTTAIHATSRRDYARNLRAWDRSRSGLLWCNGLLPATATAGRRNRVVHLHRIPDTPGQRAALTTARVGAKAVVVPSAFVADRIRGARVLPNWVAAPELPTPLRRRTTTTLGFLGRATRDKGVGVLLAALAELPSTRLVIAGANRFGDSADDAEIEAGMQSVRDRVDLVGWIPPADFFASVDVAVFPSQWPEPFGLVVAEAMAAGVPFVISDAGAMTEVAGDDYPWVARAGDATDLTRVIEALLAAPADGSSLVVERAQQRWQEHFSPAAGRRHLAALLEEL